MAFKVLTDKPIGKRPLGKLCHRWADNIKIDFKQIGVTVRGWIVLGQDKDCECNIELVHKMWS